MNEKSNITENLPPKGKLVTAGIIFVGGFLSPLLIPIVTSSDLSTGWKAALSGLLALGIPELFMMIAVAVAGKEGFNYIKSKVFGFLKKHAPADTVSKTRYRIGLVLFFIPIIVIAIVMIFGLIGLNNSKAQNTNDYPIVVQNLVDRFNLDTNVVAEVIAETRDEKHNLAQGKHEEKLNQAVIDGKITEEQKSAILVMKAEFFNKHSELSSLSFEERHDVKYPF